MEDLLDESLPRQNDLGIEKGSILYIMPGEEKNMRKNEATFQENDSGTHRDRTSLAPKHCRSKTT